MANSDAVLKNLKHKEGVSYPVLVPNLKGLESKKKQIKQTNKNTQTYTNTHTTIFQLTFRS